MSNLKEDVVTLQFANQIFPGDRAKPYHVLFIDLAMIKHYLTLDVVGGLAFFMLGKLLFHSDLLCIMCNIVATQMLHYVLPTAQ